MQPYYLKLIDQDQRIIEIKDYMIIGTDPSSHVQINGIGIEDRHCRIEVKDNKILVKDLRSKLGTHINECQVVESFLNPGDILRIVDHEFALLEKQKKVIGLESKNQKLMQTFEQLESAAKSKFPVLLLGPSGSGKDLIAHHIHSLSKRENEPFVCVNCSALTESLIESELFGHIKGAYTGALNDRKGAFETARGGTLFLDEIGDLSFGLQAKLLRALENNEIRPLGSDRTITTDVRVIAATHQNLLEKINNGEFRSDLFYRLNVINFNMPALQDRMEDFDSILYSFGKLFKVRFSFDAVELLKKYPWPGNIRELKNFVARLSATYPFTRIEVSHIQDSLQNAVVTVKEKKSNLNELISRPVAALDGQTTVNGVKEFEKQLIIKKLIYHNGNQRRTAADLGMPKSTLHDRIKVYGIDLKKIRDRTLSSMAQSLSESMSLT